jgi:hypothetical protein
VKTLLNLSEYPTFASYPHDILHRGAPHSGDLVKPGWGWFGNGALVIHGLHGKIEENLGNVVGKSIGTSWENIMGENL